MTRQAVLTGSRQFRLEQPELPALGPDDVLVAVRASGVCASELHAWQAGEGTPRRLGHEVGGEVVAVGERVGGFGIGDRVTGLFHGGYADHAVAPADRVVRLPDDVRVEHGLGEPLACAVSAARRTRVELGDQVALIGLGYMGLLMLQLVRLKGPARVIGIDMRPDALDAGRRLGADAAQTPDAIDATGSFDVVVEATGTQAGLTLAGQLVREHGVLSILGYHQGGPRQIDLQLWNFKALDVLNAHERRVDVRMDGMGRGLALAAAGRLDLAALTTHTYPLEQIGAAFAALEAKPRGFIKAVILS